MKSIILKPKHFETEPIFWHEFIQLTGQTVR